MALERGQLWRTRGKKPVKVTGTKTGWFPRREGTQNKNGECSEKSKGWCDWEAKRAGPEGGENTL